MDFRSKVNQLAANGRAGEIVRHAVQHDDWCNLLAGRGACNCDPIVRVITEKEATALGDSWVGQVPVVAGIRTYDILMASDVSYLTAAGASRLLETDELAGLRRNLRSAVRFVADDSASLYAETADESGAYIRVDTLPPICIPAEHFFIEWRMPDSLHCPDPAKAHVRTGVLCDRIGKTLLLSFYNVIRLDYKWFCVEQVGAGDVVFGDDYVPVGVRWHGANESNREHTSALAGIVLFTLGLLGAKNVRQVEETLPRNLRRHPGLFAASAGDTHYTLDIPGASAFRAAIGDGSEARRKRLHIVRGHFADYAEGKGLFGKLHGRYYIAPHVRGSADSGTVHKDYRVVA